MRLALSKYTLYKVDKYQMMIEFNLNKLDEDEQTLFFGKPYNTLAENEQLKFIQYFDLEMDYMVMNVLEINPDYRVIKKGEYPVEIENNLVRVVLTMEHFTNKNEII
jgi:hypothetical protein